MASRGERGVSRAPPPPDELAFLYKLVDKKAIAGLLCRHARNVELSAQAAVQAEALFGGVDSLVVASLRMSESENLNSLAAGAPCHEEKVALFDQSLAALLLVIDLLRRRLEADTLLPGTLREERAGLPGSRASYDTEGKKLASCSSSCAARLGANDGIHHSLRRYVSEPQFFVAAGRGVDVC